MREQWVLNELGLEALQIVGEVEYICVSDSAIGLRGVSCNKGCK